MLLVPIFVTLNKFNTEKAILDKPHTANKCVFFTTFFPHFSSENADVYTESFIALIEIIFRPKAAFNLKQISCTLEV